MSLTFVRKFNRLRRMVFRLWVKDACYKWRRIRRFVPRSASLLEIGAGPGASTSCCENWAMTCRRWISRIKR